ncbi:MAG: hypothetical protein R2799_06890 [Crocinitomicaceae bacterium]
MKWLVAIFVFTFSWGWSQEIHIDPTVKRYKMSGKIMYTTFHQGGAPREEVYPRPQYALSNYTIYVVEYFGPDQKPKLWDRITTDDKGFFSVEVKSGKFGFVLDYKIASNGQYVPEGYQNRSDHYMESSHWELSAGKPIEINDRDITNVLLINHKSSVCMDCP